MGNFPFNAMVGSIVYGQPICKGKYTGFRSIKATDATIPIINTNHNSTSTFMITTVIII